MRKRNFTIIEFFVVICIILILAGMLIPAITRSRDVRRYNVWLDQEGLSKDDVSIEKFLKIFVNRDETGKVVVNWDALPQKTENNEVKKKEDKSEDKTEKELESKTYDTYTLWCKKTGNPKKYSRKEFDALKEQGIIKECTFDFYKYSTGNPRSLTEEEFNALVKVDAFDFSKTWK